MIKNGSLASIFFGEIMKKSMQITLPTLFIALLSACGNNQTSESHEDISSQVKATQKAKPPEVPVQDKVQVNENWQLVWQDEFERSGIDSNKWSFEINCFGGGNDEKQCYTDRAENAYIHDGILTIAALREDFSGPALLDDDPNYSLENTRTQPYTSARLRTKNKGDWKYGRFEISAKLPYGQGTWPAIWMLPTDWVYGGWAGSGELDIMEVVNLKAESDEPEYQGFPEGRVHGTLHYGRKYPENVYAGTFTHLQNNDNPADDFHEYAVEWEEGEIRWYIDDVHYATQTSDSWYTQYLKDGKLVNGEGAAPFNQHFHLILNFAVGGNWAGKVNEQGIDESVFPQTFEIDYVRVYQCSISPETGKGCAARDDAAKLVIGAPQPDL